MDHQRIADVDVPVPMLDRGEAKRNIVERDGKDVVETTELLEEAPAHGQARAGDA